LLDPRTGLPARKARSVTIVSNDALTAACLARAVFVLGPKDGLPLVERLKANAIVVGTDNSVSLSKGLTKLLANHTIQQRTPTDAP
jgi:thiamine biosynthesis lipoprotein